eukprot:gene20610-biopygen4097
MRCVHSYSGHTAPHSRRGHRGQQLTGGLHH